MAERQPVAGAARPSEPEPLLAIDCATRGAAVAVWRAGSVVATRVETRRQKQAERLLALIDEALGEAGLGAAALAGFAVAVGPGSFTSVRVGIATVKGLAFGTAPCVAAISTLAADAWAGEGADAWGGPRAAVLDAQRGEWYAAAWVGDGAPHAPSLAESVYDTAALAKALPHGARIGGEAPAALQAALGEAGRTDLVWSAPEADARARALAALGAAELRAGHALAAADVEARYLRRAEAEARRTGQSLESAE